MAIYTADYIKQLVREDHKSIQEYIKIKGNDFRSYIDRTIPFALYLDIDMIRDRILSPNSKFIQDLGNLVQLEDPNQIIKELDNAYIKLINNYIDSKTLVHITSEELENKLHTFELSILSGNIVSGLKSIFNKTLIIDDMSVRNKRAVILYPRFTTTDSLGKDFRKFFNYSAFSDTINMDTGDSPRKLIQNYLISGASTLQNIGHIEVEVQSSESKELVRGLVSPRLLQALVELPNGIDIIPVVRKFSKETGQAETRLVVKKTFSSQKLIMEMLVKHGISIGTLESQAQNLLKAPKEAAFGIGKGLTQKIRDNPSLLLNLVTSKSYIQYLTRSIADTIVGRPVKVYNSKTEISKKSPLVVDKVSLLFKNKYPRTTLPKLRKQGISVSLANLEAILRSRLALQIKENMGTGSAKDVLNYRTGRFAETATIERATISRAGMVSVFYDYMRYPYATFSQGGKQQYPRSREPKTLIAKSIREIGSSMAYNRMRAVLV